LSAVARAEPFLGERRSVCKLKAERRETVPHPSKINSHAGLAFILGLLCVIGAAIAFLIFGDGSHAASAQDGDSTIEKAAEAVSGG
jgi:hypothetical protein